MPLLATLASAIVGLTLAAPLHDHFLRLAAGGASGGLAYLALSWITNREWANSMLTLLGRREARV